MSNVDKHLLKHEAQGRWGRILQALVPNLNGALDRPTKHGPCPIHGGKDGFRFFKDYETTGGAICGTCGSFPDGITLISQCNGWDFPTTLTEIHRVLGEPNLGRNDYRPAKPPVYQAPELSEEEKQENLMRLKKALKGASFPWSTQGKRLTRYLSSRGLHPSVMQLRDIRISDQPYYEANKSSDKASYVGTFPCMLAAVRNAEGKVVSVHRTYLSKEHDGKAEVAKPKKLMSPCDKIQGSAIRLGEPVDGHIGIAEGIETALAVKQLSGETCWAAISNILLEAFIPPLGITKVTIYVDKDLSLAGQRSAAKLAERLRDEGHEVRMRIPKGPIPEGRKSVDFCDTLNVIREARYVCG